MGSKYRLKALVKTIEERHDKGLRWVEPFAGGLGSAANVTKFDKFLLNDLQPGLMAMFNAVRMGQFDPPSNVSEEEYKRLKEVGGLDPLSVFVSFACSWGGKQWGGYARSREGFRAQNYAREGRNLLYKKLENLKNKCVEFLEVDYRGLVIQPDDVVYCDPPYQDTTKYKIGGFDHDEFWDWAEEVSETNPIYVLEFQTRPGWEKVWERERSIHTSKNGGLKKTELLLYKGPKG